MVKKSLKVGIAALAVFAIALGIGVGISEKNKRSRSASSSLATELAGYEAYESIACIDAIDSNGKSGKSGPTAPSEESGKSGPTAPSAGKSGKSGSDPFRRMLIVPGTDDYQRRPVNRRLTGKSNNKAPTSKAAKGCTTHYSKSDKCSTGKSGKSNTRKLGTEATPPPGFGQEEIITNDIVPSGSGNGNGKSGKSGPTAPSTCGGPPTTVDTNIIIGDTPSPVSLTRPSSEPTTELPTSGAPTPSPSDAIVDSQETNLPTSEPCLVDIGGGLPCGSTPPPTVVSIVQASTELPTQSLVTTLPTGGNTAEIVPSQFFTTSSPTQSLVTSLPTNGNTAEIVPPQFVTTSLPTPSPSDAVTSSPPTTDEPTNAPSIAPSPLATAGGTETVATAATASPTLPDRVPWVKA